MSDRCIKGVPVSLNNPSIGRSQDLCADCGHCLAACLEEIGVARQWTDKSADAFSCIRCGQCAAACPEWVVRSKSHWREVVRAINDPQKIVVFSTAPFVCMGLGECFGGRSGDFVEDRVISVLRELGADYILDVVFSADLAITERGTEFFRRFLIGSHPLSQSTSCCPAWVKYVRTSHSERIGCLSSAKSPISTQGALIKTYFAQEQGIDPGRIVNVAIIPCTAEKFEISREELYSSRICQGILGLMDNDYVLTVKELTEWVTESGIEFYGLDPSPFDSLMEEGSEAGVISGNIGGIMEAALRVAYSVISGEEPVDLLSKYRPVRGLGQVEETVVSLGGRDVHITIIYSTRTAEQLIGTGNIDSHDFVEIMTCPGGCIGGGGQSDSDVLPVPDRPRMERIKSLHRADEQRIVRSSLDNREIKRLYERFLGEPTGELAQTLLHTCYHGRKNGE